MWTPARVTGRGLREIERLVLGPVRQQLTHRLHAVEESRGADAFSVTSSGPIVRS